MMKEAMMGGGIRGEEVGQEGGLRGIGELTGMKDRGEYFAFDLLGTQEHLLLV